MTRRAWAAEMLAVLLWHGAARAQETPALVVLDVRAERGMDEGLVRLLSDLLLTRFTETGRYEVIGERDEEVMLGLERKQDLLGCSDATGYVELTGALGASLVVASSLGRVGDCYLLNVKIINGQSGKVEGRWSRQIEGVENKLMGAMSDAVRSLSGGALPDDVASRRPPRSLALLARGRRPATSA